MNKNPLDAWGEKKPNPYQKQFDKIMNKTVNELTYLEKLNLMFLHYKKVYATGEFNLENGIEVFLKELDIEENSNFQVQMFNDLIERGLIERTLGFHTHLTSLGKRYKSIDDSDMPHITVIQNQFNGDNFGVVNQLSESSIKEQNNAPKKQSKLTVAGIMKWILLIIGGIASCIAIYLAFKQPH